MVQHLQKPAHCTASGFGDLTSIRAKGLIDEARFTN